MDLAKALAELRQELETLNAAIRSLERLQNVSPRSARLGRPPHASAKPPKTPERRPASRKQA